MKTLKNIFIQSILLTSFASAQWLSDPSLPQMIGTGVQPQVAPTSDGGVYIVWLTDGNYHVYIQRLDVEGEIQFDESGLLVSNNNNASWIAVYHLNIAVDGDDNAIITTVDQRTGSWEVYAWKIGLDGSMPWGQDGVTLTNFGVGNMSPRLTVLPDNSAVVTWTHNDNSVLFQRISPDGALLWGDGILMEDDDANLLSPQPVATMEGNVLIQWIRQSGSFPWAMNSELYLQRYNYDGTPQWSESIQAAGPVVFPMGNWSQQLAAEGNGGSFLAWTQMAGNVQNAVAQLISVEGVPIWTGGVDFSTNSSNFRMSPKISIAEETQELMAVWREANGSQSQRGISAQRLDNSGNRLWGENGITVADMNPDYDYLDLSVVGFGEEIISIYIQQSTNMSGDIYAKRLDAEGNSVWTEQMVTVTNSGTAKSDMMTSKGSNYVFITWSENGSVYAHCLREDGTLGAPDGGSSNCIAEDGTGGVELWDECYSIENTSILDLSNSNLSGEIPPEIGDLTNLTELLLQYNHLSGSIPPEIGNLTNLQYLWLQFNQFTGSIPSEIGNLTSLISLKIGDNQLTGSIPPELWNLTNLDFLAFHNNQLTGEISSEIGNLTNLVVIWLSENFFTGSIPSEIGSLENLAYLYLYDNQFTGDMPSEIGYLTNLERLQLHRNQLTGFIPGSFCDLSNLTWSSEQDSLYTVSTLFENQLCPVYPSCVEDYVGEQDTTNCEQVSVIDETLPIIYNLDNAYPNPFNPITTLRYEMPEDALVNISIYDMMGRHVKTLVHGEQAAGYRSTQWNATNNLGEHVSAGMYICMIQAGEFRQIKKLILLK